MRATQTLNTAFIDEMVGLADDLASAAEREASAVFNEYAPRLLDDLQYEPEPHQGKVEWVSRRQQRKVSALLRQQAIERGDYRIGSRGGIVVDDLRYERTHQLGRGWKVEPVFDGARFALVVSNPAQSARFVVGSLNMRSLDEAAAPQQPFHAGRWPLAAKTVAYWLGLIRADYAERMADTFGDYVKTAAKRRSRR